MLVLKAINCTEKCDKNVVHKTSSALTHVNTITTRFCRTIMAIGIVSDTSSLCSASENCSIMKVICLLSASARLISVKNMGSYALPWTSARKICRSRSSLTCKTGGGTMSKMVGDVRVPIYFTSGVMGK